MKLIKINGNVIENTNYPNGEIKLNTKSIVDFIYDSRMISSNSENKNIISFYPYNPNDILELVFTTNYIKQCYNNIFSEFILDIKYLPYSRMDRIKNLKNDVFSLKYYCDIINNLGYSKIQVEDCHSDVGVALLNNSINVNSFMYKFKNTYLNVYDESLLKGDFYIDAERLNIHEIMQKHTYIVYPDTTAIKRYSEMFKEYKKIISFKNRNWETGKIESIEVINSNKESITKNSIACIVDDICSYGGTFIGVSEKLREMGFGTIVLAVTHCENSIFSGNIFNENSYINYVITSNSILNPKNVECLNKLTIMEI
ncbi:MAG: hypothetical protein PHT94_00980 [Candidatus Nanoarchaeia archaeon]|nr:hypothetical protein [Candidatus Nanoarchaeia archaeon]